MTERPQEAGGAAEENLMVVSERLSAMGTRGSCRWRRNDLSWVGSNPQELDQKRHHNNKGDRTDKRDCPTHIAKYSSLVIIVGAESGGVRGARGRTGGTWPAMATAGDVPAPIARWAALLINSHGEPPRT